MIDTLWVMISRSLPARSTPMPNAMFSAARMPNRRKATTIDSTVKTVRVLRRMRLRHTSGRYFMRPAPRTSTPLSR